MGITFYSKDSRQRADCCFWSRDQSELKHFSKLFSKSPVSSKQVLPPACKPELQFCLWSFICLSLLFFFSSPMPSRFLKGGIPPSNYEISLVQVPVCTTGHETEGNRRSGFTHRCFLTFDDPLSASSSLTKPTKLLSESSSRRHKILSAYRAACSCFMRIFML